MKLKKGTIVILAVFIIVTILNITFHMAQKRKAENETKTAAAPVFTVRTENAETRTLEAYLEVNANIISEHQVAVIPDAGGRIAAMGVALGSTVKKGELIAQVDPSKPGNEYALSPVKAPVSGTVISTPLPVGSTVSTISSLMTIAVADTIEIEALIPEREVGQLRTGLKAVIRLEAFPGEKFDATLTQVSPVVDPVSRTKKITMTFDQTDPRINTGMFARVKLNTRKYENVVSIPQDALVDHRGKTVVFVMNNSGTPHVDMREVTPGVTVDREVEIKSGLKAGDAVVVQGQQFLTDGAQVRLIGKSTSGTQTSAGAQDNTGAQNTPGR